MRIIHTSDLHLDAHNRFDDTLKVLDSIIIRGIQHDPDMWIFAGDNFPVGVRASLPAERYALKEAFQRMARVAPVFVIKGNHDPVEHDLSILDDRRYEKGIYVQSVPDTTYIASIDTIVGFVPWPSKGFLVSRLPDGVPKGTVDEACRVAMRSLLRGIQVGFHMLSQDHPEAPRVLIGHLNVTGSSTGGFTLVGEDVEVGVHDLEDTGADYVALGHIHLAQSMSPRVHYSGSPRRVNFGEESEDKTFIVAEIERAAPPEIERILTDTRPMQTILADPFAGEVETCKPGAEVRVIFELTADQRKLLDISAELERLKADQAHSVKVEYRMLHDDERIRSDEIRDATTDRERLLAYFKQLDPPVMDDEADRLAGMAEQLSAS